MASESRPVSRWCRAALVLGLLSLGFGLASVISSTADLLVLYVGFGLLTLVASVVGLVRVRGQAAALRGRNLAWWGLSLPSLFFVIASVLMPAT